MDTIGNVEMSYMNSVPSLVSPYLKLDPKWYIEIGSRTGHSAVGWAKCFGNDHIIGIYSYHGKYGNDNYFVFNSHIDDCIKVNMFVSYQENTDCLYEVIKERQDG